MLEIVFYHSNQDLSQKLKVAKDSLVICPNPGVADSLREIEPMLETVTISKWSSDRLKNHGLNRIRKSDLMLKLSSVWRTYYPQEETSIFNQSFELFTELRSYTLNLELLNNFLHEVDESIRRSIFMFWAYLENENLVDEHLGYKIIGDSAEQKAISFVGFRHLSGTQIDMLKLISERSKVQVYIPQAVFNDSLLGDWFYWLETDLKTNKEKLPSRKKLKINILPKGKTNYFFKDFISRHPDHDLLLASTQLDFFSLQEVQLDNSFFKIPNELFSTSINSVIKFLRQKVKDDLKFSLEELNEILKDRAKKTLEEKNYREFKIIEILLQAAESYGEFRSEIDKFAIDIFEQTLNLNAPRTSLVKLESHIERQILGLDNLNFSQRKRPLVVLATANAGSLQGKEKGFSEPMLKALSSIGPVKRSGLDFIFYKYDLLEALSLKEAVLYIEEDLLHTSLAWREILKHFELEHMSSLEVFTEKKVANHLLKLKKNGPFIQKNMSASKFQSYVDCPQKYFFTYIEKIDSKAKIKIKLGVEELGRLEHKIIADYFNEIKGYQISEKLHNQIAEKVLEEYIESNKLSLSQVDRSWAINEIKHLSLNGIQFLTDYLKNKEVVSIKFEVPIPKNSWAIVGSIDCIIELKNNEIAIIDFKRSGAACGTKTETLEFEKVQLWIYLLTMLTQEKKLVLVGYLNLSEIEENKLLFFEDDAQALVAKNLSNFELYFKKIAEEINNCIDYAPMPRNSKVCEYCGVKNYCTRRESLE